MERYYIEIVYYVSWSTHQLTFLSDCSTQRL